MPLYVFGFFPLKMHFFRFASSYDVLSLALWRITTNPPAWKLRLLELVLIEVLRSLVTASIPSWIFHFFAFGEEVNASVRIVFNFSCTSLHILMWSVPLTAFTCMSIYTCIVTVFLKRKSSNRCGGRCHCFSSLWICDIINAFVHSTCLQQHSRNDTLKKRM